ncbi:MAG: dihydrofolate reductase [Acidiferrobacteraceae bacterium]
MHPKISLVAAMAQNRGIGRDNHLPWRLPADLRHFRRLTTGGTLIMGRKTFESLGRPLPERHSIIISRSHGFRPPAPCLVVDSWASALATVRASAEVFVIGGASLYAQTIDLADRIYLTLIHANVEADAYFPEFTSEAWQESSRADHPADGENVYPYSFLILDRRRP